MNKTSQLGTDNSFAEAKIFFTTFELKNNKLLAEARQEEAIKASCQVQNLQNLHRQPQ